MDVALGSYMLVSRTRTQIHNQRILGSPPTAGTDISGLEVAGEILATGPEVTRVAKIGILAVSPAESIDAFLDTLEGLGWIRGKTLDVVFPDPSSEDATLARNLRYILAAGVDLVVAQTRPAVLIATKTASAVPVVMGAFNGDPVKEGIVRSLERPGGNVTGTYYLGQAGGAQRLALLKDLIPGSRHVGVLMNPQSCVSMELAENLAATARDMDFRATVLGARTGAEVDRAFDAAADAGVQAVLTVTGADMYSFRKDIVRAQAKHRLPTIMASIGFPELGGLARLGPDIPVLWRKMAAAHVDPILKGADPGDLPLVGLEDFELVINLRTAKRLRISVSEAVKRRAAKRLE